MVPLRSLSLSGIRAPSHITGIVAMTGTNMASRCKKRKPVAMGSTMYVSSIRQSPFLIFFEFFNLSGTCSANSCRDISNICASCVLPLPLPFSSSSSAICTKAAGVKPKRTARPLFTGEGGGLNVLRKL